MAERRRRKGSGELATEEAAVRKTQTAAQQEKAVKAAAEQGLPEPASEENRQDVLIVAGHELRHGAEIDEKAPPFAFDPDAEATPVDHLAVASNAQELRLELDGKYFTFDVQQAVALNRLVAAGAVSLNF
jgi:hypothetical protein